jgi:hypothetical protein
MASGLAHLKTLVEQNAVWFLLFFGLSVLANLLEILSYLREGQRWREETRQREADRKRLATYEYLFDRADKQVMTQAELKAVDDEISKRSSAIPELERRIEQLRQAAKREVITQNIERTLTVIQDAYEELQTLRTDHMKLGALPNLPDATRKQIEEEVKVNAMRPYEFPKSLAFRCLLLVFFIVLLPWPVDTVLTLVFLHVFLSAFFDVANLSRQAEIREWIMRHRNKIGLLSAVGSWYLLIQAFDSLLGSPFRSGTELALRILLDRVSWLSEFVFFGSRVISTSLTFLIALYAGWVHWRTIRRRVLDRVPQAQVANTAPSRQS